jgi:hypothetical protein
MVPTDVREELTTVLFSVVPVSVPAGAALRNAKVPSVPPVPIFSVEVSVPANVSVLLTVRVFEVVPPATVNPIAAAVRVRPLTLVGVIAPRVRLMAGVVVGVATVPETPAFGETDTIVTPPPVGPVGPATVDAAPVGPVAPAAPVAPVVPVGPVGPVMEVNAPLSIHAVPFQTYRWLFDRTR